MSLSYGQRPGVGIASWDRSRPRRAQRTGDEQGVSENDQICLLESRSQGLGLLRSSALLGLPLPLLQCALCKDTLVLSHLAEFCLVILTGHSGFTQAPGVSAQHSQVCPVVATRISWADGRGWELS